MKLWNKVRIVPAAASGTDKTIAARFAREDRQVAVADSIACVAAPINRHHGVRPFTTGVLIGTAILVVVFVLV